MKSPLDGTDVQGCDSIHSANTKHFKKTWTPYTSFDELVETINSFIDNQFQEKQHIIITGGEPILQHKSQVFLDTIEYYISRGHEIFVETNGTIPIDFDEYPILRKVNFSISVKMSNSNEKESKRWKPEVAYNYMLNTKKSYFKFVLNKEQCQSNCEIFDYLSRIPTYGTVYCMPQGATTQELNVNAKAVYEFCLYNGFRYSDRIHIRIYEDKRGV